jgi:hypothetical protein
VARAANRDSSAILILFSLALLAFAPWWAGGRLYAPLDLIDQVYEPWAEGKTTPELHNHFTSDAITQYLVYRKFAERSFAEDGAVGWSSLTFGGRPEYANTMAGYNDWSMQLHRFFDFWTAWHLGLLGQFLIAGVGMLVFLRSERISVPVALLGAVAYAANSQFIFFFYHRWLLGAFAWIPWVVWAMHRYRAGQVWAWPLVPLFLALAFLGGNLQTSVFVVLAVGAVWLGWLRTGAPARRLSLTGHLLAWGILGAGLAAFALLPEALTALESGADRLERGSIGYAHGLRQPFLAMLLLPAQLFPSLLGSVRSMDLAKALLLELPAVAYFGFLLTLLAYRAVFIRRVPAAARWLIAFGLLLPLTPLVGPLYHRVQLLFIFGGIWAATWYWEHTERDRGDRVLRMIGYACAGAAVLWVLASLATVALEGWLVSRIQEYIAARIAAGQAGVLGGYREWMLARGARLIPELRIWQPRQLLLVLAALAGFGALHLRARYGVAPSALVLLGALVAELGIFAAGWVTVADPERHPPYPERPDIAAMRQAVGAGRVYVADTPATLLREPADTLAIDPCAPGCREIPAAQLFFPRNTLAMYGVATIQQYESVSLRGIWAEAGYATDAISLGRLAVTHAVSPPGRTLPRGWALEYQGEALWLWRNQHALPQYLALPPEFAAWPGPGALVGDALEGDALEGDAASARPAAEGAPHGIGLAGAVQVTGTQNRRLLEVPSGTAAVRVAENWSEGWRYRSGTGPWKQVKVAADRSMLIPLEPVPATQLVEMHYRPRRRIIGWWLTLAAAALTALGGVAAARARRTPEASSVAAAVEPAIVR